MYQPNETIVFVVIEYLRVCVCVCVCVCLFFQDLRTSKTGSGTESGEVTVATWQYYDLMHEVLGARPAIDPPVLVSSIQEDPMVILMVRVMWFHEFH